MHTILAQSALTVGKREFDVADLVLVGHVTGAWPQLERDLETGLEAAGAVTVAPDDVRAAATSFRVERGLISASDFKAWLVARSISIDDLSSFLTRKLARGYAPAPEATSAELGTQSRDEVAGALRTEAVCSDTLEDCATTLAAWLAAELDPAIERDGAEAGQDRLEALTQSALADEVAGLPSLGAADLRERLAAILAAEDAHQRLGTRLLEGGGLEDQLRAQRLEWLRIDGVELEVGLEGAAREARLLVRDDGCSLDDVAGRVGLTPYARSLYLDEAPEEVKPALASAEPGGIVGPWQDGGRWRLLWVGTKSPPSTEDAVLRERARRRLLDAAVGRLSAGRIRRHVAL